MTTTDTITLLLDGARGIYVPRTFYRNFDLTLWGLDAEEYRELDDTDHALYWDTWDDLCRDAVMTKGGHTWTLWCDEGNLFAVRDDHRFDDEGDDT